MKSREEVDIYGKPAFYCVLFDSLKKAALECGYTLAIHGSMMSDFDLVAVPWVENVKPVPELISSLNDCLGGTVWKQHNINQEPTEKPHGRIAYTLAIFDDWYLDVSVIVPKTQTQ